MPEQHLEKRGQSMVYKLNVTEHADELLDKLVSFDLSIKKWPGSEAYLSKKGYREAVVPQMNYIIIFDVRGDVVNVVGIFHQLENYPNKL